MGNVHRGELQGHREWANLTLEDVCRRCDETDQALRALREGLARTNAKANADRVDLDTANRHLENLQSDAREANALVRKTREEVVTLRQFGDHRADQVNSVVN